jgi:hypothetical protein
MRPEAQLATKLKRTRVNWVHFSFLEKRAIIGQFELLPRPNQSAIMDNTSESLWPTSGPKLSQRGLKGYTLSEDTRLLGQ